MLSLMLLEYNAEGMSLRNDSGSQFIAGAAWTFLKEKGILAGVLTCGHSSG
jgi:putative transposase